jgi:hypothetical protein
MTAAEAHTPEGSTGYRLEELAAAFDRVMNPRDWQAPIRSVIPSAERPVVEQAVLWFTHTPAEFEAAPGGFDRLIITALGYRLGARAQERLHA